MKIKNTSSFKHPEQDKAWLENWATDLEKVNKRSYQRIQINTSLGKTQVWGLNTDLSDAETIVIFPGARTTALFWDLDNGLDSFALKLKIYLVETNGLPNGSDGNTPDIKSNYFGDWATEVFDALKVDKAFVAGASFGGLICMKLSIASPNRVKAAFLLNPGCLQPFSLTVRNLYYNILPIVAPSKKNISKFLDKAVFCKPNHNLSEYAYKKVVDYELFALTRYIDKTQKPYDMGDELQKVKTPTYLLEGDKDLLFPFKKSIDNAHDRINSLKEVRIFENVGHGIETHKEALGHVGKLIRNISLGQN